MKTIAQRQAENVKKVISDGPALRYGQNTWIEAVTEDGQWCLQGGLGSLGVGTMWVAASQFAGHPDLATAKRVPNLPVDFNPFGITKRA